MIKWILKRLFPGAFMGTPQYDANRIPVYFKPYLLEQFVRHFNHHSSDVLKRELFTDDAPLKMVLLATAPAISSYTFRWGFDKGYHFLISYALIGAASLPESAVEPFSLPVQFLDGAVRKLTSQRQGRSLDAFCEVASEPGGPVFRLYLESCFKPELACAFPAEHPAMAFAARELSSALTLMRAREKFLSPLPQLCYPDDGTRLPASTGETVIHGVPSPTAL